MFVVDASIALTWCLEDESTIETDSVLRRLLLEGGIAPAHWPLEMANALRSAERRGRVDSTEVERAASIVIDLPIDILPVEVGTAIGTIETARRLDLSVYDATYIDLARVRGLGLATLDVRVAAACSVEGIRVIAA
ncbi:MAG: type II toxin-antitoxin system VapC family toxin [Chloroflexota bacterium]|nr:type II toxin-antitoxin system VapC family toxin [Chloroflexota bacterium]